MEKKKRGRPPGSLRKVTEEQRQEIRELRGMGVPLKHLAERFKLSVTYVHDICKGSPTQSTQAPSAAWAKRQK